MSLLISASKYLFFSNLALSSTAKKYFQNKSQIDLIVDLWTHFVKTLLAFQLYLQSFLFDFQKLFLKKGSLTVRYVKLKRFYCRLILPKLHLKRDIIMSPGRRKSIV